MSHTCVSHIFTHDSLDSFTAERQSHAAQMRRAIEVAKEKRGLRQAQAVAARTTRCERSPPQARRELFSEKTPAPMIPHSARGGGGLANKTVKLVGLDHRPTKSIEQAKVVGASEAPLSGRKVTGRASFLDVREAAIRQSCEREAQVKAGQDAQQAFAISRAPGWWPRTPKPVPRGRVATPNTVARADGRLHEIRTKLEAGCGLTPAEEADATAIIELKQIWKDADARAAAESTPRFEQLDRIPCAEGGYEAAALLTGGFGGF